MRACISGMFARNVEELSSIGRKATFYDSNAHRRYIKRFVLRDSTLWENKTRRLSGIEGSIYRKKEMPKNLF